MTFYVRQLISHLVVFFVHCIFLVTKHRLSEIRSHASILLSFLDQLGEIMGLFLLG